jgi:diguanylate cyclase (GGDEF)-like protein
VGEEFMVILTETDINQASIPLERFRKTVETLATQYENKTIDVTVSIGACQYNDTFKTKEDLLRKTDEALYEAKNSGRNKTVFYKD